jgi:hypothetical protein
VTGWAALYWLLTAVAGGLVAGLVRTRMRVEERAALAVVSGVLGGTLASLGFSTALGMRTATVLAGPALLALIAVAALRIGGDGLQPWRQSLGEVGERWRSRELVWISVLVVAAVAGFSVLFTHMLFVQDGAIQSNFATVWADWSMHATTASSFALGHNLPPTNPVFSGTTLLYPFLPDFESGMLLTLGAGVGAALAVPSALMCVAITVLVVSLARRLSGSLAVGVLAVAMCMLGGGLGVEGLYWDSCRATGASSAECEPGRFLHNPAGAIATAVHTVVDLPASIASQRRPYDNLQSPRGTEPLSDIQWYTPMLAWWLPQRPFLFGFAAVLCILLVIVATRGDPRTQWGAYVIAGMLAGLLPLVHVHSFIAVLLLAPLLAVRWRRREWLGMGIVAVLLATPRLFQLATGEHGAPALGNTFPWLEPGWMSQVIPDASTAHQGLSPGAVAGAVGNSIKAVLTPQWWGFWFVNCGIVLPVMAAMAVALPLRRAPRDTPLRRAADRVTAWVPDDVLRFTLPFLVIFALCNVVVFQSWDWDNTKLFAYWYFGASLLLSALVVRAWRSGAWRATAGGLAFASVIMTGAVVMLRFMPWTPPADSNAGPFTWASAEDRALAAQVAERTPPDSVIATDGRHDDPLMTLAGRRALVGYTGWLWSYGIDYRTRQDAAATILQGCAAQHQASCAATDLIARYGVSYVEVRLSQVAADVAQWWATTYPPVAQAGDVVVYDVRTRR